MTHPPSSEQSTTQSSRSHDLSWRQEFVEQVIVFGWGRSCGGVEQSLWIDSAASIFPVDVAQQKTSGIVQIFVSLQKDFSRGIRLCTSSQSIFHIVQCCYSVTSLGAKLEVSLHGSLRGKVGEVRSRQIGKEIGQIRSVDRNISEIHFVASSQNCDVATRSFHSAGYLNNLIQRVCHSILALGTTLGVLKTPSRQNRDRRNYHLSDRDDRLGKFRPILSEHKRQRDSADHSSGINGGENDGLFMLIHIVDTPQLGQPVHA